MVAICFHAIPALLYIVIATEIIIMLTVESSNMHTSHLYDKVYDYYSMWNVRNNMNQRNIESTQKLTEYA